MLMREVVEADIYCCGETAETGPKVFPAHKSLSSWIQIIVRCRYRALNVAITLVFTYFVVMIKVLTTQGFVFYI